MSAPHPPAGEVEAVSAALHVMTEPGERTVGEIAVAAILALEAYRDARNAARIGTHGPDCWAWGPRHYECALRRIEASIPLTEDAGRIEVTRRLTAALSDNPPDFASVHVLAGDLRKVLGII